MNANLFYLLYVLLSISVSMVYWVKDSNKGFKHILVSVHSVMLLTLVCLLLAIGINGFTSQLLLLPLYAILLASVFSVIYCLNNFTGSKWYHLAQIWNIVALLWTLLMWSLTVMPNDWEGL